MGVGMRRRRRKKKRRNALIPYCDTQEEEEEEEEKIEKVNSTAVAGRRFFIARHEEPLPQTPLPNKNCVYLFAIACRAVRENERS